MLDKRTKDILSGLGLMLLAAYAFFEARQFGPMGAVFPIAAATILALSGLAIVAVAIFRAKPGTTDERQPINARMLGAVAVLGAWAVCLPIAGFFWTSAVGFVLMAAVTSDRLPTLRKAAAVVAIAVVSAGALGYVMEHVLLLALP